MLGASESTGEAGGSVGEKHAFKVYAKGVSGLRGSSSPGDRPGKQRCREGVVSAFRVSPCLEATCQLWWHTSQQHTAHKQWRCSRLSNQHVCLTALAHQSDISIMRMCQIAPSGQAIMLLRVGQ